MQDGLLGVNSVNPAAIERPLWHIKLGRMTKRLLGAIADHFCSA